MATEHTPSGRAPGGPTPSGPSTPESGPRPTTASPVRPGPTTPDPPPLLAVAGLVKTFPGRARRSARIEAVSDVSFSLGAGECLAIVGESGSGKSTLARCVLRLVEPDAGSVRFRGTELIGLPRAALRAQRRHMQLVFQDPYASLHPRQTVAQIVAAPWAVHPDVVPRAERAERVRQLLSDVGLPSSYARLAPGQLSGGQRQRVALARALALAPQVLILDEPVSALDVSIQAQVIRLIMGLQERLGLAYVFISHDLGLVRLIADRVMVMRGGRVVEAGPTDQVYAHPAHAYTRALLAASPRLDSPRLTGHL